jgi:hypothetical protein
MGFTHVERLHIREEICGNIPLKSKTTALQFSGGPCKFTGFESRCGLIQDVLFLVWRNGQRTTKLRVLVIWKPVVTHASAKEGM